MEIKLNSEEVKKALLIDVFSKTGLRLQPDEVELKLDIETDYSENFDLKAVRLVVRK